MFKVDASSATILDNSTKQMTIKEIINTFSNVCIYVVTPHAHDRQTPVATAVLYSIPKYAT